MTVETKSVITDKQSIMVKKNNLSCALNLAEDSLDKILSLTASCHGGECEISGGEIIYGGSVTFNAVFSAEEINRVEAGAKFTFKAPLDEDYSGAVADYSLSDVRVKNEGGMLYAVCDLISRLKLVKNEEMSVVTNADCLYKTERLATGEYRQAKSETVVDDEFSVKRIKRALYSDAQAIVTSLKAGDGFITVDGEVVLNVCLLPFSENSDILKEVRNIPFRYEMDLDGVTEDSFLSAKAEVSKTSLKIFVDEEKDNSVVSAEIGVAVFADAYSLSEIDCVSDAYSPSVVLELKREPIERLTGVFTRFEDVRFRGQGLCKVPDYSRLNKTIGETIAGYSVRTEGNDLIVDGEIRADALFSDSDNVLSAKELIVPISFSLEGAAGSEIAQLLLRLLNVRLKGGEIECEVSIKASVIRREITTFSVVTGIEEGAEKAVNDSAISVYIGKALDTEWDVIKALGESAEKIAALNPDVVYPLSGGERIVVFRNKK